MSVQLSVTTTLQNVLIYKKYVYYFVCYLKCAVFEFTDFIHIDLFYYIHTYYLFTIQKKKK